MSIPRLKMWSLKTISMKRKRSSLEKWLISGRMSLEQLVTMNNKETIKTTGVPAEGSRSQFEDFHWTKLGCFEHQNKQNFKNYNVWTHIKYVKIHKFLMILKQKPHYSPLDDTKNKLILKLVKTGKES